jgi:hypothetical protein
LLLIVDFYIVWIECLTCNRRNYLIKVSFANIVFIGLALIGNESNLLCFFNFYSR